MTSTLTDNLHDARNNLLRAYVACQESERDRIGAIISQLDQLIDGKESEK